MTIIKLIKEISSIRFDNAFGLDIGDRSIEIIELEKVFKYSVSAYGRVELPAGVVEDGLILKPEVLAENVKKLLNGVRPKKVSTNKVVLSLPATQVYSHCFDVEAKLKKQELEKIVLERVSAGFPLNIDKCFWDFIERPLADKNKKLIIFFGVPKGVILDYIKFCNSIGLEIASLCVESLNLARVLLRNSDRQSLIIDIGSKITGFNFFDNYDKLNMSIVIPVAGEEMTRVVMTKFHLAQDEAEAIKARVGFKENKDKDIRSVIMPTLTDIMSEASRAIMYYETTFKQKVDEIILTGGSALLPGIVDEVKKYLKIETRIATNNNFLNLKAMAKNSDQFSLYANVIGLGMHGASGDFRELNILQQVPSAQLNVVNKLNLFRLGYLSPVNTIRTIFNNKYILIILILLIGVIFAILIQQAHNYGLATASSPNLFDLWP